VKKWKWNKENFRVADNTFFVVVMIDRNQDAQMLHVQNDSVEFDMQMTS